MDNMVLYETGREVPANAKKPITGGRLKGMTDINPMWRIKILTQMFGPCGIGWWYEITDKRIVHDEITGQKAAFVDILLFYVDPNSGAVSHGVPGTGGAGFVERERNGPYMTDECFKKALTDAISVSAKALGIGASVYWDRDETKHRRSETAKDVATAKAPAASKEANPQEVRDAANLRLEFGKYEGATLGEVFKKDREYARKMYVDEETPPAVKGAVSVLLTAIKESRSHG